MRIYSSRGGGGLAFLKSSRDPNPARATRRADFTPNAFCTRVCSVELRYYSQIGAVNGLIVFFSAPRRALPHFHNALIALCYTLLGVLAFTILHAVNAVCELNSKFVRHSNTVRSDDGPSAAYVQLRRLGGAAAFFLSPRSPNRAGRKFAIVSILTTAVASDNESDWTVSCVDEASPPPLPRHRPVIRCYRARCRPVANGIQVL